MKSISENTGTLITERLLTEEEEATHRQNFEKDAQRGSALEKISIRVGSNNTGSTTTPTNNIEGVEDNSTMFMIIVVIVVLILFSIGVLLLV